MGLLNYFNNLFLPPEDKKVFNAEAYLHDLNQGKFRGEFNLGICGMERGSWVLKNFEGTPNGLFVGAMGSGKSSACVFTVLTWMLANADQTILFIVDIVKGAQDYKLFFDLPQTYLVDSDVATIRTLDLAFDEVEARNKKFKEVGAKSVSDYENITGKKMSRILIVIEEFHAVNVMMQFDREFKNEGTPAYKFYQLMRIGRSMGVWFLVCSQRSLSSDIPKEVVGNFTQKQIFQVTKGEASYVFGDDRPSKIPSSLKGRCYNTEVGEVQFPKISDGDMSRLLKNYIKENDSECAYLNEKIIIDYLKGKSNKEIYRHKKFIDLVNQLKTVDADIVIEMMHEEMGYEIIKIEDNSERIAHIIIGKTQNGTKERVAVMVKNDISKMSEKYLRQLLNGMMKFKCDRGIVYTTAATPPKGIYNFAKLNFIEIVDFEDAKELAQKIDYKKANGTDEDFEVDKLAKDEKEDGSYQSEHHIEDEDADSDEIIDEIFPDDEEFDLPEISELDMSDEKEKEDIIKEDNNKVDLYREITEHPSLDSIKNYKRPQVSRDIKLNKEDSVSVLIHCMKNESNEVYRVLIYTLVDNKVKHKYFFDRKVSGRFDLIQKRNLRVNDVDDWNNHPLVFNEEDFKTQIDSYLKNFDELETPIYAICWKNDVEFVKDYFLSKSIKFLDTPTIMDERIIDIFMVESSREELIESLRLKITGERFFEEIEKDFSLWAHTL